MPDEYTVEDVAEGATGSGAHYWEVIMRRPDGKLHGYAFPKDSLEWRAAEYGLSDPAEILDVVLHEPFKPRPASVTATSLVTPAARVKPAEEPVTLWTAKSTSEARAAHLALIASVKSERVRVIDPRGLLAHITTRTGMTTEGVRAKQERVDVRRWEKLYGGLPVAPIAEEAIRA